MGMKSGIWFAISHRLQNAIMQGKIRQELAIDQIRMIVQQPALIDSIQPHISSSDHFLLTRSVHMEFRKLSIEDMNELFQSLTLIFIRLLDRHDAEISAVQASRLGLQAAR